METLTDVQILMLFIFGIAALAGMVMLGLIGIEMLRINDIQAKVNNNVHQLSEMQIKLSAMQAQIKSMQDHINC